MQGLGRQDMWPCTRSSICWGSTRPEEADSCTSLTGTPSEARLSPPWLRLPLLLGCLGLGDLAGAGCCLTSAARGTSKHRAASGGCCAWPSTACECKTARWCPPAHSTSVTLHVVTMAGCSWSPAMEGEQQQAWVGFQQGVPAAARRASNLSLLRLDVTCRAGASAGSADSAAASWPSPDRRGRPRRAALFFSALHGCPSPASAPAEASCRTETLTGGHTMVRLWGKREICRECESTLPLQRQQDYTMSQQVLKQGLHCQ